MVHRVRTLAAPPILADDEQTRLARLLHIITAAIIVLTLVYVAAALLFTQERGGIVYAVFVIALASGVNYAARRAHVQAASVVFSAAIWLMFSLILTREGLTASSFSGYIVPILIAGFLIGGRASLVMATLCAAFGLFVLLTGPRVSGQDLILRWVNHAIIFYCAAVLITLATDNIRQALARARRSESDLAERNQQLEHEIAEREQAEAAYRVVVESSVEGLAIFQDYRIVFANAAQANLLGYSIEELLAMPDPMRLVHPDDLPRINEILQTHFAGRLNPPSVQYRSVRKDGTVRWVEVFAASVMYEGKPALQYATLDITERKLAEEALRASEEAAREFQEKLVALNEVSIELARADSLAGLYRQAIELGRARLGFERLGLLLYREATNTMSGTFGTDAAGELRDERGLQRTIAADSPILDVLRSKARVRIMEGAPLYDDWEIVGHGWNAMAVLWNGDTGIGWIAADNLLSGQPLKSYQPELLSLFGITLGHLVAQQQAEEALKRSEERFSRAFHSSPIPQTISTLAEGRFVDVNESCLNALEYVRAEMVGYTVEELQTWVDPQERAEVLRLLETQGTVNQQEVRFRTRSGGVRDALASFETIELSGEPYLLGSWQDITERKRTEADLKRSEERFYQAFHANPTPITLSTVHDARFVDVNESLLTLFGYTREEMIGRTAFELNSWADFEERSRIVAQLEAEGTIRQMEARFRKKSGEVGDALISVDVIEIAGEGYLLFMIQDITERKQAEAALKRSEERFFKAFHANPIAISISTLDEGRFVDVNASFLSSTGFSREEIVGHTGFELGFWDTPEERQESVARLRAEGHVRQLPALLPTRSGPKREALTDMELIELAGEQHLLSMIRDVTEQRHAEKALRLSEERFFKAFEANPTAISISTLADGRYVDANESFLRFTGYTRDQLIGHTALELGFWNDDADRADVVWRLTQEPRLLHIEAEFMTPDGETRYGLTSMEVIEVGGEPHLLSMVQDVTERKQAEQQAMELALSREREASLRDFLSTISHDLKTPLSVINTSLYLLERVADPKRQQEKIETIKAQSHLLEKYIQDILTISRLDHTPSLARRAVDLHRLLAEVVQRLRPSAERKNLTAALDLSADTASVLGDENELDRVLVNLIENAMIYTPANGSIRVHTVMDTRFVVAEIADTGIGIKEEDLPRIFERFYRSEEAQEVEKRGTGLGLAIVKKIVELHEGSIEVSSTVGVGTTFRVRLPVA